MMRPEELEAARRAGPCCRRPGGIVACVAASIVVALVLVLGGEELNVASRHSIQQQTKLLTDYDMLADGLQDLSDLLPQLESHMERMVEGLAGTVDSKLGALWRAMDAGLKQVQEEQHRLVEAATAAASPPPPPPAPEQRLVLAPTSPAFLVATEGAEEDLKRSIADADMHWKLMRRLFLERQAAQVSAAGGPLQPGAGLVVDAGCGRGSYSLYAAAHGHRVLCLEPDAAALPLLERSLAANNATGHLVWVQPRGLGQQRSQIVLPGQEQHTAHLHPLSDFVSQPVELVRLDVDGYEMAALQGSKSVVEQHGVAAFLMDVNPAQWSRAGTSLDDAVGLLTWLQQAGRYRAYVLPRFLARRGGPACPPAQLLDLGVVAPAGEELRVRASDDSGDEGAGRRALRLGEPFETAAYTLLRAMQEHGWVCTLWLEQAPLEAAAATAAPAAGEAAIASVPAQQAQQLEAGGAGPVGPAAATGSAVAAGAASAAQPATSAEVAGGQEGGGTAGTAGQPQQQAGQPETVQPDSSIAAGVATAATA